MTNRGGSWYDYDDFLRPEHLRGKRVTLEIARADEVETYARGGRKVKPVLYFKGTPKYLFLNNTNRRTLIALFGDDPHACAGQKIALQVSKFENGKEGIVIFAAGPATTLSQPSAPLARSALDALWDLASQNEVAREDVEALLTECGGDADAAREQLGVRLALPGFGPRPGSGRSI